jgi:hypothetical protein
LAIQPVKKESRVSKQMGYNDVLLVTSDL